MPDLAMVTVSLDGFSILVACKGSVLMEQAELL